MKLIQQGRRHLLALIERIDQLGQRDRMALAAGALAAVIGIEMMIVQPMRTKRLIVAQSIQAENTAQDEAERALRAEREVRLADMQQRIAGLETKLNSLGLKEAHRDTLSEFLNQTALRHGLLVASARNLPVEELTVALASADPAAAAVGTAAPPPPPTLYRHRAELKLQGAVVDLTKAIESLERGIAPLRIERVLLAPTPGGALQATVVFTTISQERSWLMF